MAKPKKKIGRPTKYTKLIEDEIIERITNGEAVTKICDDPKMPCRMVFFKWLSKMDQFSNRYAQALNNRTHLKAEQRHDIIEDAIKRLENLPEGVNAAVFGNLIKEKIRVVEWDAERLAAKKYKITPDKLAEEDQTGIPVNVTFNVSEPVGDISVTNAKP